MYQCSGLRSNISYLAWSHTVNCLWGEKWSSQHPNLWLHWITVIYSTSKQSLVNRSSYWVLALKNFADQDLSEMMEMDECPLLLIQLKAKSCVCNKNQILCVSAKEIRNLRMSFPYSWPAAAGLVCSTQSTVSNAIVMKNSFIQQWLGVYTQNFRKNRSEAVGFFTVFRKRDAVRFTLQQS